MVSRPKRRAALEAETHRQQLLANERSALKEFDMLYAEER